MTNFEKFPHKTNSNYSGTTLSSWSRQQKVAMLAAFVILGILLALSACSKESPKTALVGISKIEKQAPTVTATPNPTTLPPVAPVANGKKMVRKPRPAAVVTYSDPKTGVSFRYPRRYELASGDKVEATNDVIERVPMNFVQPGGQGVAIVTVPANSY